MSRALVFCGSRRRIAPGCVTWREPLKRGFPASGSALPWFNKQLDTAGERLIRLAKAMRVSRKQAIAADRRARPDGGGGVGRDPLAERRAASQVGGGEGAPPAPAEVA